MSDSYVIVNKEHQLLAIDGCDCWFDKPCLYTIFYTELSNTCKMSRNFDKIGVITGVMAYSEYQEKYQ